AHAEERLQLVGTGRQSVRFGDGDRECQAANIVAAKRRAKLLVVLEQEPRAPLERRIALPLLKIDWLGPAQPPRAGDFIVPVRTLDQPDRDRSAAAYNPLAQHPELALGITMVRLDDNSHVGPVAEFRLLEDRAKQLV